MNRILRLATSTLGRKYVMGITGIGLVGFIIIHMLGNLQIFLGQETLNHYAVLLKSSVEVLWGFRLGLLTLVVLHIASAVSLAIDNRKARPVGYCEGATVQASYASRTMKYSGVIVLAFLIYHILHFTAKVTHPEYRELLYNLDGKMVPDVYTMVIHGFSSIWISAFYILSVALLCMHLSHGVSSMFQSLGLRTRSNEVLLACVAKCVAIVVFIGMSAVPTAVLLKIVQ